MQKIELKPGDRFGQLTFVKEVEKDKNGSRMALCNCDCGGNRITKISYLRTGAVTHCKDRNAHTPLADYSDLIGVRIGHLVVTGCAKQGTNVHNTFMSCNCDCGGTCEYSVFDLKFNKFQSCGCLKRIDPQKYIGRKFGHLTITAELEREPIYKRAMVLCDCDCGEKDITCALAPIVRGDRTTCGKSIHREGSNFTTEMIKGERYGHVTVICATEVKNNKLNVIGLCDCGMLFETRYNSLRSGNTKSCGCGIYDTSHATHGLSHNRIYSIWKHMIDRCYNPNNSHYSYYGGRGIAICDEWRNSIETFYQWALNNGFDETKSKTECSIDRIDVNGNYEPSNCRWVDSKTQANNTRRNHYLTIDGVTHTIKEWSEIYSIDYGEMRSIAKDIERDQKILNRESRG